VSALELSRRLQVTYKSALFLAHRIKHAMGFDPNTDPKLTGTLEADETYVGPKMRGGQYNKLARARRMEFKGRSLRVKTPVFAVVQRGGEVRTRVIASVTADNIRSALVDHTRPKFSELMTDDFLSYKAVGRPYKRHGVVRHSIKEYVRPEDPTIHTNTIEGFFSRVKRKLNGTHHAVSKQYLGAYIDEAAFIYNTRHLNDGERTVALLKRTEGKRLMYREPRGNRESA
jgi:hypothetical protein